MTVAVPDLPLDRLRVLLLLGLVLVGLAARLPHLATPPLDFHPTRQYRSALLARGHYLATRSREPEWRRQVARENLGRLQRLELPIMEHAAVLMYRATGGERLWLPRLLSVVFWLVAGLFLYQAAARLFSTASAAVALAFHLLAPYGLMASRSFQPEPLLVCCLAAAIAALVAWTERPTIGRLVWLAAVSGVGTLVKPVFVFFVVPAGVLVWMTRTSARGTLRDWRIFAWLLSMLVPAVAFYLWPMLQGDGGLSSQARMSVLPGLVATQAYWRGWLQMIDRVVGVPFAVAALAGLLLQRERTSRALVGGLWLGYAVFGLVFTYHIHTHDYYSLPLVPIVGLGLASLSEAALRSTSSARRRLASEAAIAGVLGLAAIWGLSQAPRSGAEQALDAEREKLERFGELVEHSVRTITLDSSYGFPMFYHGELSGSNWPLSIDRRLDELQGRAEPDAAARLSRLGGADYFVVNNLAELGAQPDLQDVLARGFPTVARGADYLVYDLRRTELTLDRTVLNFAASSDGTAITGPQELRVVGGAASEWTVASSTPSAFTVTPSGGRGRGSIRISAAPGPRLDDGPPVEGTVSVTRLDPPTELPQVNVSVRTVPAGASAPPIGFVDLPADGAALTGPIVVAGWALDDIEVVRVGIYLDAAGNADDGLVFLGEAMLLEDVRPDVEAIYPEWPFSYRAGWGHTVEPRQLPNGGNGPFTFRVYAEDREGNRTLLGTRRVTARNPQPST